MAVILDALVQLGQLLLVLLLAPLLTGYVRKVKAHLLRRRGPPILQPYRDLLKLLRKEVVLADNASWVFRVAPYLIFATTWVAAALVPTFATGLVFSSGRRPDRDRRAARQRALHARAGRARRRHELRRHRLEPRDDDRLAGRAGDADDRVHAVAARRLDPALVRRDLHAGPRRRACACRWRWRWSALVMVAIAENARIPVDNPATHLELTMVHEAMILEYSGRHLAVIEAAASLKLLLYLSLIGCVFAPWGVAVAGQGFAAYAVGLVAYVVKLAVGGFLLAVFETAIAKMRVFRVSDFLGAALMLGLLATLLLFVSRSV